MFRQFSRVSQFRRLYSQNTTRKAYDDGLRSSHIIASSTAIAVALLWYSKMEVVHCDALSSERVLKAREALSVGLTGPDGPLSGVVWGSNQ